MNTSPKFALTKEDLKRHAITLLKLLFAIGLTHSTYLLAKIDFGQFTPVVVAFWTAMIDLGYRWVREVPQPLLSPEQLREMNP